MRKLQNSQKIDSVFTLLIFCAFAAAVLLVLILGAQVYENVTARSDAANDHRLALSYIGAKISHNDTLDNIYVDSFWGYQEEPDINTLYLEEDYGDISYHTMIYLADGWIRELYCQKGLQFNPQDGLKILEAQELTFYQYEDSGLLYITCMDKNGSSMSLYITPRCIRGVSI